MRTLTSNGLNDTACLILQATSSKDSLAFRHLFGNLGVVLMTSVTRPGYKEEFTEVDPVPIGIRQKSTGDSGVERVRRDDDICTCNRVEIRHGR